MSCVATGLCYAKNYHGSSELFGGFIPIVQTYLTVQTVPKVFRPLEPVLLCDGAHGCPTQTHTPTVSKVIGTKPVSLCNGTHAVTLLPPIWGRGIPMVIQHFTDDYRQ